MVQNFRNSEIGSELYPVYWCGVLFAKWTCHDFATDMNPFSCKPKSLHQKISEVSIKTRSTPASRSFVCQATKHTTVKWSFIGIDYKNFMRVPPQLTSFILLFLLWLKSLDSCSMEPVELVSSQLLHKVFRNLHYFWVYYRTKYLIYSAHFQLEYWNSTDYLSNFFESFGVTLLIKLCMTLTNVIERKKQAKLFCVLCFALADVNKIK